MVPVIWAEPALADLEDVYRFIAKDSPRYARSMVERLTAAAERLGDFPKLGGIVPEYAHRDYRQRIVAPYRLIYREDAERRCVIVLAAIHGARDYPPLLENR